MPTIPQPPVRFILGNTLEIDVNDPLASLARLHALYGEIFKLKVPGATMVVISSQEIVDFVSTDERFDKRVGRPLMEVRNVAGDGLFTAHTQEPNWQLAHRLLIPAFGPVSIRGMFDVMVDIASQMTLKWERFEGEEIDVCEDYTRLTLDAIALASFNYRFNSFYSKEMHPFVAAMTNVLKGSQIRSRFPSVINTVLDGVSNKEYWQDIKLIHKLADDIVRERRLNPRPDVDDLLNRMINGKDTQTGYQLSDDNIRFQLVTFLIAGHETTSGLLSFATYYLLKNPECLLKARKEADNTDLSEVENISKLVYIEAVLKETLRLRSSAPAFFFGAKEDVQLPGGYLVTKDDAIAVYLNGLHRDTKVWSKPEEFDPERMMPENFDKLPPNCWKPFGNGQRSCIGRGFAMQESMLTLAMVLRTFDLELVDPAYELKIKTTLTIKPEGLRMRAHKRKDIVQQQSKLAKQKTDAENVKGSGNRLLVLYGSNSGSCEAFANSLAKDAGRAGYRAVVSTMDGHAGALPQDHPVVIITASYEGKPCDNAKVFVARLEAGEEQLEGIKYAVFGCGHHDWKSTYQKVPKLIDLKMREAGAESLVELGSGDAAGDFFGAFEEWKVKLFTSLSKLSGLDSSAIQRDNLSVEVIPSTRNIAHIESIGKIIKNEEIVTASSIGPAKRHIEIALPAGQTYRAGDYLAISPFNSDKQIDRVLKQFNMTRESKIRINGDESADIAVPAGQAINFYDLVRGHLDLASPATKSTLNAIAATANEKEAEELQNLVEHYEQVIEKRISVLDALHLHPSSKFSVEQFLQAVPALRIRQYSISSSPLWNPTHCTISIDILRAPALSGLDEYRGVASNYLADLAVGDEIACAVRLSSVFHLPDKIETPIVMFAAGSGIAPFRGFLQERAQQAASGRDTGKLVLYFGCRTEHDFMYKNEIEDHVKNGLLELHVAYSQCDRRIHVPQLVYEQREALREHFLNGASFYTCGSATKLASSLKQTALQIVREFDELTEEEAAAQLRKMTADRYAVDVFA